MRLIELLSCCKQKGIELKCADGKLKVAAPPGALTTELKLALKQHKEGLLSLLFTSEQVHITPLPEHLKQEGSPLSFAQKRLFFLAKLEQSNLYNIGGSFNVEGSLDLPVLQQAMNIIVARHQVLHTVYFERDGEPLQKRLENYQFQLDVFDLTQGNSNTQNADQGNAWPEIHKSFMEKSFDLEKDILLRVGIVLLAQDQARLMISMHHIAADGWSLSVLSKELNRLYCALAEGEKCELTPLPIQYADFAHWQQLKLQNSATNRAGAFWLDYLQDMPFVHQLPLDKPRPQKQTFNGDLYKSRIHKQDVGALKTLSNSAGSTLFMSLHSILATVLASYSQQQDIVIGTPIAGRNSSQLEPLVGCFVNTLLLRTKVDPQQSFHQLLKASSKGVLQAFEYQQTPFEWLVEQFNPERSLQYNPLFQIMFTLHNNEHSTFNFSKVSFTPIRNESKQCKFDLTLDAVEDSDGISLVWRFSTDIFARETIARLDAYFAHFLQTVCAKPNVPIRALNKLPRSYHSQLHNTVRERFAALTSTNNTELSSIADKIAATITQHHHRIAIETHNTQYSYAELQLELEKWQRGLMAHGIAARDPVGIYLKASEHLSIATLALFQMGAVFVPLDPDYPQERLEYMIQDSGVKAIITDDNLALSLPVEHVKTLTCCEIYQDGANFDGNLSLSSPSADSQAYVIYTSGSTGKPKGVSITHGNALHYFRGAQDVYQISYQDRFLQFSSPSFDIYIEELLLSLLSGATLVIANADERSSHSFWQNMADRKVTIASLPTAFWHLLCSDLSHTDIPALSLRLMITGGEKMSLDMLRNWQACAEMDGVRLLNTYGPTETTVIASTYDATHHSMVDGQIPIGTTVANACSLIVDGKGGLALPGAIGELVIAGPSVSPGYLNLPAVTDTAFPLLHTVVHDLPPEIRDLKCYRTGDLVRLLPNELLSYQGRADDQIKRSGYRITLGEIEAQLLACESVSAAVVVYNSDKDQLAALLVPAVNNAQSEQALLSAVTTHVTASLPHFMRPALYGVAEAIPLTQNGKTDTRQVLNLAIWLPANEQNTPLATAAEKLLGTLWARHLNVDLSQLFRESNFFEVGGHSLLAAKLVHDINDSFDVQLGIRAVFETESLSALSAEIEGRSAKQNQEQQQAKDILIPKSALTAGSASFAQRRLWYLQQLAPSSSHYNIADVLTFDGILNAETAERAVKNILQQQDILRTVYAFCDGELQQQVLAEAVFSLDILRFEAAHESTKSVIKHKMQQLSRLPFDLSRDLPIRVHLAHSAEQTMLLLCVHHIAADGWSVDLFWQLFRQEYSALSAAGNSAIKGPKHQYIDYALWQYQQIESGSWNEQLSYWQNQLKGMPDVHSLTSDFARPEQQSFAGESLQWYLPQAGLGKLKTLAADMQTSLFTLLHTAFSILLWRRGNSTDVVLGSPLANRGVSSTAGLIGYFANTLVLRTQLSPDATLRQYMEQVKRIDLDSHEHQEIPFDYLVEVINPKRTMAINPLVQIVMTLEHMTRREVSAVPDRQWVSDKVAKFDLGLHVKEYANGLALELNFCKALYRRETIGSLATQLTCILDSLADGMDCVLTDISLQQPLDTKQYLQLTQGQALQSDIPASLFDSEQPVDYFSENVKQNPLALAVACGSQSLTYLQLDEVAGQLLADLGSVKPGDVVAVCLPRSIELAVVFTAVLKAKAVYLPIDHKAPQSRIEFILDNANADRVISLTDSSVALEHKNFTRVQSTMAQLAVYTRTNDKANQSKSNHLTMDTAYCIFTSGSTGQPKGVMVSNASILNTCRFAGIFDFGNIRAFLSTSNPAFDGSVFDLYNALLNGKGIVMVPNEQVVDFRYWEQQCQTWRANAALITTALFNLAVKHSDAIFRALTQVAIGGEVANTGSVHDFLQKFPDSRLYNLYGPTETSVVATASQLTRENARRTPIGTAICGNYAYVLDEQLRQVPAGCEGELYIGGEGVGIGYIDLPEKTRQAFVTDPFAPMKRNMYRTGDRVKVDCQGQLVFMGRMDEQVKIRGHRIELSEIEQHIDKLAFVEHAIVSVCNSNGADKLQCHLVLHNDVKKKAREQHWVNQVNAGLVSSLPAYMCPAVYGFIDELPITANGKVDKTSLPTASWVATATDSAEIMDVSQQQLAELWCQVLEIDISNINGNSDFFNLGGHSLLVVKLKVAIEQQLAVEVSISELFNTPVFAQMARLVASAECSDTQNHTAGLDQGVMLFPASAAQRSLWLIDKMMSGSRHYTIQFTIDTAPAFDLATAQRAIVAVIERHEPLRTIFDDNNGDVLQRVMPEQDIDIAVQQTCHSVASESDKYPIVNTLMTQMSQHHFQLDKDLLLRAQHIQFDDDKGVLVFNTHHIAFDGWSKKLFCQDFKQAYAALAQKSKIRWSTASPIRYLDYTAWQQDYLASAAGKASYQYWEKQLSGAPVRHSLPMLDAGRHVADACGKSLSWKLPDNAMTQLQQIAQAYQVSHFMVLHAVLHLTISAYSGESDIVIGTPTANRSKQEQETAVGLFINTVALRVDLSRCETIADVLTQIKQINLDALSHQSIPFEHVVDAINPQRDPAFTPLFQVLLTMEDTLEKLPEGKFASVEQVKSAENCQEKFDFSMHVTPSTQGLGITLNYRSALFCPELMTRFARTYNLIFSQLDSDKALHAIAITDAKDRAYTKGVTSAQDNSFVSMSAAFEHQAQKTPEAIALVYDNQSYSYAWVNRSANLLAQQLLQKGIQSEQLVGICLHRSPLHVVSLLAVLKCGASYVPMDPNYPRTRLDYIAADAAIRWVISDSTISQKLSSLPVEFVVPDLLDTAESQEIDNPRLNISASSLAYIIYTSGTTGNPKGVMIEQGNAMEMLTWAKNTYTAQQLSGVLMSTSICFDLSVFETFAPLTTGGTCVIVDHILDTSQFVNNAICPVTLINTVPSAMVQLLENGLVPDSVRIINLAGEALTKQVVDKAYGQTKAEAVYNLYGPSEDTTYSTFALCQRDSAIDPDIGKPVNGCEAYVLDKQGRIVPVGVKGELYITGTGLSRGYLNKAGLTDEKFVNGESLGLSAKRLYRTGDLVALDSLGNLQFIGRNDQQVKLNGYRVELGEIESSLTKLTGIERAAVIVSPDSNYQYLMGFVELESIHQTEAGIEAKIKTALYEQLPVYMVPQYIHVIDRMPLNINGKIDRNSLRQQYADSSHHAAVSDPSSGIPETPVEKQIAVIWQRLLDVEQVKLDDNFFTIGGRSLLAIQAVNEMNDCLGWQLSLTEMFKLASIRELVAHCCSAKSKQPSDAGQLMTLRSGAVNAEHHVIFIHPAGGDLVCYEALTNSLDDNWNIHGISRSAAHNLSLEVMAQQYANDINSAFSEGRLHLVGYSFGGTLAFEIARQLGARFDENCSVNLIDAMISQSSSEALAPNKHALQLMLSEHGGAIPELLSLFMHAEDDELPDILPQVLALGKTMKIYPDTLTVATLQRQMQVYASNLAAFYGYQGGQFAYDINLLIAEHSNVELANRGWLQHTQVESHSIDADHFSVLQECALPIVAGWLANNVNTTSIRLPTAHDFYSQPLSANSEAKAIEEK